MSMEPALLERLLDGRLGDFVERDAAGLLVLEAERFLEMPGDGLAFAVGVGRQVDHVRRPRPAS